MQTGAAGFLLQVKLIFCQVKIEHSSFSIGFYKKMSKIKVQALSLISRVLLTRAIVFQQLQEVKDIWIDLFIQLVTFLECLNCCRIIKIQLRTDCLPKSPSL